MSLRREAGRRRLDEPVSLRRLLGGATAPRGEVSFYPASWRNWAGLDAAPAHLVGATPADLGDLVSTVEVAADGGLRVRAVGAGHSTSTVARPDDIVLNLRRFAGVEPARWLRPAARERRLFTVGAGTRIKHLNRVHLPPLGVALPNMGSFDWQTLAGAVTTGTHGSALGGGPLSDIVVSYDLVVVEGDSARPRVRAYRLEPDDGPTDPDAFAAAGAQHGLTLLRDDELFYASLVAFGATGIVVAMTLELDDAYWVREDVEAVAWSELRDELGTSLRIARDDDFYEFLVNAAQVQTRRREDPVCSLRRRNRIPVRSRPDDWPARVLSSLADRPAQLAQLGEAALSWPPRRTPAPSIAQLAEDLVRPRPGGGRVARLLGLAQRIEDSFTREPGRHQFLGDLDRSRSDLVLRRVADYTDDRAEPEPPPATISNEIAVPAERTGEAVDLLLDRMRGNEWFYAIPFGVRFTAASPHLLAPQFGRETCMIEIPLVLPTRRRVRHRLIGDYHDALADLERALCHDRGHVGGRPHWGQYHELGPGDLERLYPASSVAAVRAARARFDGAGIFSNAHTDQLGL